MRKNLVVHSLVLVLLLAGSLSAFAAVDNSAALDYLRTQQNPDGGFGSGMTPESSLSSTADVVLAIVAAGGDPGTFDKGGNTPASYLAARAPSAANGGDLAKLIMAAVALGENPRQFGGVDSVAKLEALATSDGKIGSSTDTFFSHCLAVLALASAQRPIPAGAVSLITAAQQDSGGWAWDGSEATQADTNTTAVAVEALAVAAEESRSQPIAAAMSFFKGIQNADGGWPYQNPSQYGTATDANSTAVTIQAVVAAGQDPAGADWQSADGQTPVAALEALQNPSGGFAWQSAVPGDNLLATVQALPALAGKAFPLATMDVGPAATVAATPVASAAVTVMPTTVAAVPTPNIVPVTGGGNLPLATALVIGGLVLFLAGATLLRRRA